MAAIWEVARLEPKNLWTSASMVCSQEQQPAVSHQEHRNHLSLMCWDCEKQHPESKSKNSMNRTSSKQYILLSSSVKRTLETDCNVLKYDMEWIWTRAQLPFPRAGLCSTEPLGKMYL